MKKPALFLFASLLGGVSLFAAAPEKAAAKKIKPAKIEIAVVPGALRYATTRFDVTAGAALEITLNNTCVMPHNLVLVKPGKADAVFTAGMALGNEGLARDFVPKSDEVIAATKLVSPGMKEELKINAPKEPGEYPYLCTFPGHGVVMRGVMRVRAAGEKLEAAVTEKLATQKIADALKASEVTPRPMGTREHPFVLRSFIPNPEIGDEVFAHHDRGLPARPYNPGTGKDVEGPDIEPRHGIPGGIAVNFGKDFSYAWDSTECRLLYAWTGGFLDMWPYWGAGTGGSRVAFDYIPQLDGTLVFKTAGAMPLRMGDGKAKPKFRGYRLLSGAPEFSYEINGVAIHEHIVPADPGTFMMHFRIERPPDPVRLVFDSSVRGQISCDQGSWHGDTLEIPADHADHFMLLVKFSPGKKYTPTTPPKMKGTATDEP